MRRYILFMPCLISICTLSCQKDPLEPEKPDGVTIDTTYTSLGMYVLNEGLFNMNNTTLTWFGFHDSIPVTDFFSLQNGRKLGDTGNDMAIYGSKLYVVMNISSQLEVIDPYTGKSIKRIPFFNGEKPRQPRYIAFHGSKAFVCSFDGTVAVIDTAMLEIEKFIAVGRNPDGIAVANNKVYVSNSGGLDYPHYDSTVSVIDITGMTEIKRIPVQANPYVIVPDQYGDLYVVSRGNYGNIKMCLQVIDSKTDEIKHVFPDMEVFNLAIHGDTAYAYYYDFVRGNGSEIMLINVKHEAVISRSFITDGTNISTPNGIAVNPAGGDICIADARGFVNTGEVKCFSREGRLKFSFEAGLNPGSIVFLNKMEGDSLRD